MLLRRATALPKTLQNLRLFSPAATSALALDHTLEIQLEYLPGFPRPDAKHAETILAVPRSDSGKNISAKERKAGRVPSIIFEQEDGQHGGNKRLVSVQTNQIRKLVTHLGYSFFLSRLFDVEVRSEIGSDEVIEKVRALPRSVKSPPFFTLTLMNHEFRWMYVLKLCKDVCFGNVYSDSFAFWNWCSAECDVYKSSSWYSVESWYTSCVHRRWCFSGVEERYKGLTGFRKYSSFVLIYQERRFSCSGITYTMSFWLATNR